MAKPAKNITETLLKTIQNTFLGEKKCGREVK
jgi:hypothetical protein